MTEPTQATKEKRKILVFSTLYPNRAQPRHGIFLEHRVCDLVNSGAVDVTVVAPVPWFPFRSPAFGKYHKYTLAPDEDERQGIRVLYPRYLAFPKFGMILSPLSLALACLGTLRRVEREGFVFDILDSFYFYPDGVSAAILSRILHKRLMITAFGTDINLIPNYRLPRAMIRWAARQANAITSVCDALRNRMIELDMRADSIHVILHGVDLDLFRPPGNRQQLRKSLGLTGLTVLSVGHLIERKGHHFAIEALRNLPDVSLLIAGDGEEEANLRRLAETVGVSDRVSFLGHVDQKQLPNYYGAVDLLVLASSREGIANVLIESMACGTPVVATDAWGSREVVKAPEAGILIEKRTSQALANGILRLLASYPDRAATRSFAEQFSWEKTTKKHLGLYERVMAGEEHGAPRSRG